eukprot:Gb_16178 [translate_table: standard]
MAASSDEKYKNDSFQIPWIDLQKFSQDELHAAASISGDFPESKFCGIVSPKIDKSIFNESTGSRRQTYSRSKISRRSEDSISDSCAKEVSQGNSLSSLSNLSGGKSVKNKKSSKNILDLVDKILYIMDKEDENHLNVRNSLSSHVSEEVKVFKLPHIEEQNKEVIHASQNTPEASNTPEALTGHSEIEEGIWENGKSSQNLEDLEAVGGNVKYLEPAEKEREYIPSNKDQIDTQHSLQLGFQEKLQLYEQMQDPLEGSDMPDEKSRKQIVERISEKQSQIGTHCVDLDEDILDTEGDKVTAMDILERPGKKRGRPMKMRPKDARPLSVDAVREEYEKEVPSHDVGGHFSSDSTKRVGEGSSCSTSKEDGHEFHVIVNKSGGGSQFHSNELKLEGTRVFSSSAVTQEGKEVSSDASVAGDVIAKQIDLSNDKVITEECKVKASKRAKAAAAAFHKRQCYGANLKEKMMSKRKSKDTLFQMSYKKKHKLVVSDGFIESWKNRLPDGWKVEVGLQRTKSGEYDYYHKFVRTIILAHSCFLKVQNFPFCVTMIGPCPDGVQFTELKEPSSCGRENTVEGPSGTSDNEICIMSPAVYSGSNHQSYSSFKAIVRIQKFKDPLRSVQLLHFISRFPLMNPNFQVLMYNWLVLCILNTKVADKSIPAQGEIANFCHLQGVLLKEKDANATRTSRQQDFIKCPSIDDRQIIKLTTINSSLGITISKRNIRDKLHARQGKPPIKQVLYHKREGKMCHELSGHAMCLCPSGSPKCDSDFEVVKVNNLKLYRCKTCLKTFDKVDKSADHLSIHHRKLKTKVQYNLPNNYVLNKCMDMEGSNDSYKCKECGKAFDRFRSFRGHLGIHGRMFRKALKLRAAQLEDKDEDGDKVKDEDEDRNGGMKSSNKMDSSDSMSILLDADETRVENSVYICKQCGKKFNKYRCYLGHNAAHARLSRKKRGRPRLRDKIQEQVPENKAGQILDMDEQKRQVGHLFLEKNQDDKSIAQDSIQSGRIMDTLSDPYKPKRRVGRPRLKNKEQEKEMYCKTGIQFSGGTAFVDQPGTKSRVGQLEKEVKIEDMYCSNGIQSSGAPVLINPVRPKKKVGRPRKIQVPIFSNSNVDEQRNCSNSNPQEVRNCSNSNRDEKMDFSYSNQFTGFMAPIDPDKRNRMVRLPSFSNETQDEEIYCDNSTQSVGAVKLAYEDGQTKWTRQPNLKDGSQCTAGGISFVDQADSKRKGGRPRLKDKIQGKDMNCGNGIQSAGATVFSSSVQPKKMHGRLQNIQVPLCGNSDQDEDMNCCTRYQNGERNCGYSNQDEELNCSYSKQSADAKTTIDSDAPLLKNSNEDTILEENRISLSRFSNTAGDCFARDETPCAAATQNRFAIPTSVVSEWNGETPFVCEQHNSDPNELVVCHWCDQDFQFFSLSEGLSDSPRSWTCPHCKTVNYMRSL